MSSNHPCHSDYLIDLHQVSVRYHDQLALDNISWQLPNHRHYAILGANGSGKSTLIKLLSQDIYPLPLADSRVCLFGRQHWNIWELKQHIGFITHDLHTKLQQQAAEVAGFEAVISSFYSAYGAYAHHHYNDEQKALTWHSLQQLDITHLAEKPIGQMSTGELRRCVIARALVHQPKLLLLDEPSIGLDIKAQHQLLQLLRQLSKDCSLVMVTHHLEEIIPEISHVALIRQGKIIADGTKKEVLTSEQLSEAFDFPIQLTYKDGLYRTA